MKIVRILFLGVVLAGFLAFWSAPKADAIPAFARKYRTSCTTCHIVPPKLNSFGRAFRNLGYRMPKDDEDLIKQEQTPLGAPAWKQVWPKGIWPSDIPGSEFMAIGLEGNFNINPDSTVKSEFDGLEEVGLLFGGTLGETISFYGDLELFEDGHPGSIGRAFINYTPRRWFNVTAGQFEPRAVPFSNHRRLTRQTSYLADVFPTVPAGNFFGFSPNQRGVEIWGGREGRGNRGGLMYSFGVVNGQFGGAAEALGESSLGPLIDELKEQAEEAGGGEFDVNSGKDVYGQVSYKFGGLGVFGGGAAETLSQTGNWRDDSLTLNGYVYRGTAGALVDDGMGGDQFLLNGNTFIRTGATVDWWYRDLNLFGGVQYNRDRVTGTPDFTSTITTVEAHYVTPYPWIVPAIRFENVNPNYIQSFNRTTLSVAMLVRANVIFSIDGVVNQSRAPDLPIFKDKVRFSFRTYF